MNSSTPKTKKINQGLITKRRQISEDLQEKMQGELTDDEIAKVLSQFNNEKAPWSDGFLAEFYKKNTDMGPLTFDCIWNVLQKENVHRSKESDDPNNSKKDKDLTSLKNWRPNLLSILPLQNTVKDNS